jgi:hypothetical protein
MIKNGAGKVPGLLAVLAAVPDPRKPRGRRYPLAFVLAVAAACTLAGAKTFREIGGQAADLPQDVLRDLSGRLCPLRRKITAPSETRIRTLLHLIDTEILDQILGGWLRGLADAGRLDGLLTAIAIDGKWLRVETQVSEDVPRVDVLFVGWVGLGVLAGGPRAGLWPWLSEQSGFGLDEDAAADQALELGADVLGVLGRDRQVQGRAQVAGPQGAAEVGEGVKDLLVGGVIGYHGRRPGRFCGGLVLVLAGEGDEGLAGDLQVADRLVQLAEPGGELIDPGLRLGRLAGQCLLPRVYLVQQEPARVRRGHAGRHDGVEVPVSRRAITSVIAQYTRDAELESRCS